MTLTSVFRSIMHMAAAVTALWLLSFVSAGSASAKDVLQCKGRTRNSVVACCERETAGMRPVWMGIADLSCSDVVFCGGSVQDKRQCSVEITGMQNPSHDRPTSHTQSVTSDIRLKTNIHRVGTTVLNLPLYSFEYRGKHGTYIGVMAQDVLKVEPSAVSVGADGFYRVNYQKLGIEMLQVQ